MTRVFISYRRDDASANAGRLCDWLQRQFKTQSVFLDTESIAPGDKFPVVLRERLATTDVLLAVVGKAWTTASESGAFPTPTHWTPRRPPDWVHSRERSR